MIRSFPHYVVLVGLLAATIIGFVVFSYDRAFQIALTIALAVSYVSWGIVHHWFHEDLYLEVVIEYVVIAVLGSILIISLLI